MVSSTQVSAVESANEKMKRLPDYSALKQLAAALWQENNAYHGAAVMVGAGFSRSSASTGDLNKKLPLWNDLSSILARDLNASSSTDPLRLAEEYCAYFGKQALHDLVIREINDAAWQPGDLHKTLLKLPWSEVLTTNWDTLLERASMEVHQPVYNLVSRQEDLSSARSPRIVKLHGTVAVTDYLVFTQEDYRKYPHRHAAFVNFGRQVFIENELCLLGFSGDDPNFLQWAGWVRDQLATNARRIYLVGALHLTAAKRKYLESINVAPIDLGSLVEEFDDHDTKHLEATKIFLQTLESLKPKRAWEWSPTELIKSNVTAEEAVKINRNPAHDSVLLERQLPTLEADRTSYPGWLVCPTLLRWKLQNQISSPYPSVLNISEMSPDSRAKLLYEISWRYGVTFETPAPWLIKELFTVCDPATPCALTKTQQLEVALFLLKSTRWFDDAESRSIESSTIAILKNNTKHWVECDDELAFHQAILARDRLDFPAFEKLAEKISARIPMWMLRKASLLSEIGRFEEGEKLIAEAYRELLGQYRNDRNSVYVFSRLAWAHWLLRGVETWSEEKTFEVFKFSDKDLRCSPWDHIENIQRKISEALELQQKQGGIELSFEPGSYKNNSDTVRFNSDLHPLMILEGISNSVGMPLRWNCVNFLVEPASRLAELDEVDGMYCFALAIRAANSDTSSILNNVFSRTKIACLLKGEVDRLFDGLIRAIDYWGSKLPVVSDKSRSNAITRLRILIEVLARVSVRASEEQAKRVFHLAISLGKRPSFLHFWLFDSLKHLIDYSLNSIPESLHDELLLDALSFPLQIEIGINDHREWPNPIIKLPGARIQSAALDRRIDEIIDAIAPCSPESAPALLRLLPLFKRDFLKDSECIKITEKIWGKMPAYQALPDTGLLTYVLLELPTQNPVAVRNIVRKYLYEAKGDAVFEPSLLLDITIASGAEGVNERPDEHQAIDYFSRFVSWRPTDSDNDPFGHSDREEEYKAKGVGAALARSIVPALPVMFMTEQNFGVLHSFYSEVESPEAIIAFVYFSAGNACFVDRVEKIIRQGLQELDANKVAYSSYALLKWMELEGESPATNRLVSRLIYLIGSNRMIGLQALLWAANQMYKDNYLSAGDIESLIEMLPVIFDNADYKRISDVSQEAVSVSLVRAACAKFAMDILIDYQGEASELVRLLEEAERDPLPEVRFATMK